MRLVAVADETDCIKSKKHLVHCTGTNHVCAKCGILLGPCDCPRLGTLLDY